MSAARGARIRLLAAVLCAFASLQVSGGVVVGAVAQSRRSCVVPMPCCDRGFCPLHSHGAGRHGAGGHGSGPRWVRCDDDAPPLRLPAPGPLAVLTLRVAAPVPSVSPAIASGERISPPTFAPEPELHPPEIPAAS